MEFGDLNTTFGIDGFIGNDILSHFNLTVDFETYTIMLIPHS